MERVCGPSEGERVGWDRGRRNPANSLKCIISLAQGNSILGQTSVQNCLVGLVSTAGDGPFTASLTLRVTTPQDFPGKRALGKAALAQHFRASWDYLFTVFLEQFQASQLCHRRTDSQGSRFPEAGAGCRKVIHITIPCLRRTGRALGRPNRYPHPCYLPNAHQGD